MRIATETVWATAEGDLVPAGHEDAAYLVAAKGHPIPLKKLEAFGKKADKFFKDATFDPSGSIQLPKPEKPAPPATISRLATVKETKADAEQKAKDAAEKAKVFQEKQEKLNEPPEPEHRESDVQKKIRKRRK